VSLRPEAERIERRRKACMERILVSACLLGLRCRYSGERKADERVSGLLKRQDVVLIPVCPEQLGGLPTPREPAEKREANT